MTSPLLTAFVDASENERKTLYSASGCDGICVIDNDGKQVSPLFDCHFDAERFIAERATVAGMRAMLEAANVRTVAPVELRKALLEMIGDDR